MFNLNILGAELGGWNLREHRGPQLWLVNSKHTMRTFSFPWVTSAQVKYT